MGKLAAVISHSTAYLGTKGPCGAVISLLLKMERGNLFKNVHYVNYEKHGIFPNLKHNIKQNI